MGAVPYRAAANAPAERTRDAARSAPARQAPTEQLPSAEPSTRPTESDARSDCPCSQLHRQPCCVALHCIALHCSNIALQSCRPQQAQLGSNIDRSVWRVVAVRRAVHTPSTERTHHSARTTHPSPEPRAPSTDPAASCHPGTIRCPFRNRGWLRPRPGLCGVPQRSHRRHRSPPTPLPGTPPSLAPSYVLGGCGASAAGGPDDARRRDDVRAQQRLSPPRGSLGAPVSALLSDTPPPPGSSGQVPSMY